MLTVDEAFAAYEAQVPRTEVISLPTAEASGCLLAEDARAAVDLPPFRQSAMDGYALAAASLHDVAGGTVRLPVAMTIAAGGTDAPPVLAPGTCARIFTGGLVPEGADTVVKQEDVVRVGDAADFERAPTLGDNVRERGEELLEGHVVCPAGTRLTPGLIGALSAAGIASVTVHRRPVVTVLVTGDEVVPAGEPLRAGQVYDCNTPMVTAWLAQRGIEARTLRLADDGAETTRLMGEALTDADLVITTGGVSVGDKDFVIGSAHANGVRDVFWKVRQKPGKPIYFGVREDAVLLGLPGNPAAVFVGLVVHVDRVLGCFEGADPAPPRRARLRGGCPAPGGRDLWLRCAVLTGPDGTVELEMLGGQASHMLSNLADADAIARIPAGDAPVAAGSVVSWYPV